MFHGQDRIYAYAIGILIGTAGPAADPGLGPAQHARSSFSWSFDWRNPDVRRVLLLMLPVTISLGLINFNLLINSLFGSLVSDEAPAAIDKAFRIYQLPQGIFSVAIATVLFPTLARFAARGEIDNLRATMANGMRQILFVLVPAAAAILVLSEPMIRLVYQRGEFTPPTDDAGRHGALLVRLLAADQRPLPAADPDLLQPPAALGCRPRSATIDLVVSALAALGLYQPRRRRASSPRPGSAPRPASSPRRSILRREFGGLELGRLFSTTGSGSRSPRRRWPAVSSAGLGRARRAPSDAASAARSSRSAAASALGGLVYLARREAAEDRRAGRRSCASCAVARCSTSAAICSASPRSACSPASPSLGATAFAGACSLASSALLPIWRPRSWRWRS